MIVRAKTRKEFSAIIDALSQYSTLIENEIAQNAIMNGFCRVCGHVSRMQVTLGEPPGEWRNLLEGMVCECGLNGRARLVLTVLDEILMTRSFPDALVLERLTTLYPHLASRLPGLIGSEFLGDDLSPGETVVRNGVPVRSESMMALSFKDNSLDLVMHFDILEHVPDWRKGLQECLRVLKSGGTALFTFPFYHKLEHNIVRTEMTQDGRLTHHMPPAYHGNPISSEGSLVFIHPSWEVYEYLCSSGFSSLELAVGYDPLQGIVSCGCPYPDGHVWPVVFAARK